MSAAVAEEPRLIHGLPGRLRLHLPGWSGQGPRNIETQLRQLQGVRSAQANPLTRNVLIHYDMAAIDEHAILASVRTLGPDTTTERDDEPAPPPAVHERHGHTSRARIAVRGLD